MTPPVPTGSVSRATSVPAPRGSAALDVQPQKLRIAVSSTHVALVKTALCRLGRTGVSWIAPATQTVDLAQRIQKQTEVNTSLAFTDPEISLCVAKPYSKTQVIFQTDTVVCLCLYWHLVCGGRGLVPCPSPFPFLQWQLWSLDACAVPRNSTDVASYYQQDCDIAFVDCLSNRTEKFT